MSRLPRPKLRCPLCACVLASVASTSSIEAPRFMTKTLGGCLSTDSSQPCAATAACTARHTRYDARPSGWQARRSLGRRPAAPSLCPAASRFCWRAARLASASGVMYCDMSTLFFCAGESRWRDCSCACSCACSGASAASSARCTSAGTSMSWPPSSPPPPLSSPQMGRKTTPRGCTLLVLGWRIVASSVSSCDAPGSWGGGHC